MGEEAKPIAPLSAQEKRALLAQMLRRKAEESRPEYPLSYGQRALWFFQQLAPASPTYNEAFAWRVRFGDFDVQTLARLASALSERHPILRTTYAVKDGRPVQRVGRGVAFTPEVTDASSWSPEELQARLVEVAGRPFDLERGPVFRFHVFRRGPQESILLTAVHHIAVDLWSMVVLMQELQALYLAQKLGLPADLPPLACQYPDFVRWQAQMLAGPEGERLWAYWQKKLGGGLPVLDLPTDRPRPPVRGYRGQAHNFHLSTALTARLKELARREQTTLFTTLLAALQALLARYSGQDDVLVASPMAGRARREFEGVVGMFTNAVVLRGDLSGDPTFRDFLGRARRTVLEALEHQDFPFSLLVERLAPDRDPGRTPLCDVLFVMQKPHRFEAERKTHTAAGAYGVLSDEQQGARLSLGGDLIELLPLEYGMARFDLELLMFEAGGALAGSLRYDSDLFEPATVARMVGHFETLLAAVAADPAARLSALPLLSAAQRRQLVVEWNDTFTDEPGPACAHELFEARAERTPEAVAVVSGDRRWTYRELNDHANRLARYLRGLGVGRDCLVGLCVERSPETIAGLLGILKAGGAFVPLDPTYPRERLAFLSRDARVPVLLTEQRLLGRLPETGARVVCLDADWEQIARESPADLEPAAGPDDLAYVIYTSGSTGAPKGVMVAHRGLCNLARAQIRAFDVRPDSRVLQFAPLSFDASVSEIFMALGAGAALHLAAPAEQMPGPDLVGLLRRQAITTLTLPPSALAVLPDADLPALRSLIVAGEACPADLLARWAPGRRFFNAYGPTEVSVCATIAECSDGIRPPPIGRPIANTTVYVLDRRLRPVPAGVAGELYVGGVGLARGYLGRPALTADRFVPDPFGRPGGRLYRTGDRARWRADGQLEFLGRLDQQVKVRGFRVELGEVEAALAQHPGVRHAAVVVREDGSGDRSLVACVVGREPAPTAAELRSFLEQKLPGHLIPSAFVALDALPLTPSGKVDRRALSASALAPAAASGPFVPPRDDLERDLACIWQEVLQVPRVGVRDNFFQLGGHSLSAVRVAARIQKELGVSVPLASLIQGGTVEHLADLLRRGGGSSLPSVLVPLQPGGSRLPLFCIHATAGTVFCYRELSRLLGAEQPFWGVQAPGLAGEQEPLARIEDMAEHYFEAIRQVQPRGPYLLAGWSLGGVVAFEMARQARARGEEVGLLAVLDVPALGGSAGTTVLNDPAEMVRYANEALGPGAVGLPLPADDLDGLSTADRLRQILEQARAANLLPVEVELSQAQAYFEVVRANLQALARYVPGPYAGPVTFFRAAESPPEVGTAAESCWRGLAAGGLEMLTVPGGHHTMLEQPHVPVLAARLAARLAQQPVDGSRTDNR
jgi:amino acid adenylation domain-containing protein